MKQTKDREELQSKEWRIRNLYGFKMPKKQHGLLDKLKKGAKIIRPVSRRSKLLQFLEQQNDKR